VFLFDLVYRWFLLAAQQGHESAKEYKTKLERTMSSKDIDEAKRLA